MPRTLPPLTLPDGRQLPLDRPLIMGILNVTPDSFSDGGEHADQQSAREHARLMLEQGADIIDIGGESTRPGSQRVSAEEQMRRVIPAVRAVCELAHQFRQQVVISVDTTLAPVASAALEAGADILNDISAGLEDPAMFTLAARSGAPLILMHMQGTPATMQINPQYTDVVAEVTQFLQQRAQAAIDAGIKASQIVLDPGIGFGKTREHNLALLAHLDQLVATGYPVLLGTSRKRFMGSICASSWAKQEGEVPPPSPQMLVGATCATTAWGVSQGVHIFRVHDVMPNRQSADVAHATVRTRMK